MALIASDSGGGGFDPVAPGTYVARCVSVIDLGLQPTGFGDKEKVYVGWEIPGERVEWEKDGQKHEGPALIGSRYTNSINEKSILGQLLISWRGKPFTDDERKGFDLFSILNAPCMLNVIHNEKNGKVYANIQSVMRLPQGTECPPPETDLIAYSPMDESTVANFAKLPEWQQKLVREGYKMAEGSSVIGSANTTGGTSGFTPAPPPGDDAFDDSIPF